MYDHLREVPHPGTSTRRFVGIVDGIYLRANVAATIGTRGGRVVVDAVFVPALPTTFRIASRSYFASPPNAPFGRLFDTSSSDCVSVNLQQKISALHASFPGHLQIAEGGVRLIMVDDRCLRAPSTLLGALSSLANSVVNEHNHQLEVGCDLETLPDPPNGIGDMAGISRAGQRRLIALLVSLGLACVATGVLAPSTLLVSGGCAWLLFMVAGVHTVHAFVRKI